MRNVFVKTKIFTDVLTNTYFGVKCSHGDKERRMIMEQTRNETETRAEAMTRQPDKNEYLQRIRELSAEDQAFMDGYLFAKVTERREKGA